ncbi:unnamed protein product, partial [Coregonus sp. 'balchen']
VEMVGGKVLEETYMRWIHYKDECVKMIDNEPFPQGLFCNRTFDRYACWPDGPPGLVVNVSCPSYLPWFDKEEQEVTSQELWFKQLMVSFRMLYTVGYTLSLFTLVSAVIILLSIRKLHCTRNYIHANLFVSFILRAVSVIVKDTMLERHWGREIMRQADLEEMLSHEAIYLYSVLIASVFIENNKCLPYICLGWGTPLLFVIPWMLAKLLRENKECWAVNENMSYWWIIRFPILFASLATLTLIPLFGIHEVIFIFATDEQTTGILRYIKVFFTLFLNSFQGFLVAVLYCYCNKEVCGVLWTVTNRDKSRTILHRHSSREQWSFYTSNRSPAR